MSAETKRKNICFPDLALPNRILSYAKIAKGERKSNKEKQVFKYFPHHPHLLYTNKKQTESHPATFRPFFNHISAVSGFTATAS